MNLIDQIFWRCVDAIEYLGNLSGLGYELTNIILFVIIQPLLILVFLFLVIVRGTILPSWDLNSILSTI